MKDKTRRLSSLQTLLQKKKKKNPSAVCVSELKPIQFLGIQDWLIDSDYPPLSISLHIYFGFYSVYKVKTWETSENSELEIRVRSVRGAPWILDSSGLTSRPVVNLL